MKPFKKKIPDHKIKILDTSRMPRFRMELGNLPNIIALECNIYLEQLKKDLPFIVEQGIRDFDVEAVIVEHADEITKRILLEMIATELNKKKDAIREIINRAIQGKFEGEKLVADALDKINIIFKEYGL